MPNVLIAIIAAIGLIVVELIFLKAMRAEKKDRSAEAAGNVKTRAEIKSEILSSGEILDINVQISDLKDRLGVLEVASGLKSLRK
jgi:uncharacterized membrane protein